MPDYYSDLMWRTMAFAVVGSLVCFAGVGMYRHWMRYSVAARVREDRRGRRARRAGADRLRRRRPTAADPTGSGFVARTIPTGVLVLFGLLLGAFLTGTRFLVHLLYQRPWNGFRPRRDARSVLIVGAGDGGRLLLNELLKNPALALPAGRLRRRRPEEAGHGRGARHDRRPARGARRRRARRGDDRDPVRPRHAAGGGRQCLPQPRHHGAHRADRLRARPDRRPALPPAARRQGRGRAGARPGADGDRVRRRLPDRPDRPRHRRRRLDRLRAVPPDRPREPAVAGACSTPAKRTCSRSIASCATSATCSSPRPSLPTARTRSACARSSTSTGRRSCSTPPRSSTSR